MDAHTDAWRDETTDRALDDRADTAIYETCDSLGIARTEVWTERRIIAGNAWITIGTVDGVIAVVCAS